MFDWRSELTNAISTSIREGFLGIGNEINNTIFNFMLTWMFDIVYSAVGEFFVMMGNMGADIFELKWVEAVVYLFTMLGWALFVAGVVVAVFDLAIEYQNGRADIKSTMLNILKGFFACSLIGVLPIELYKFCITLQGTFLNDLSWLIAGEKVESIGGYAMFVFKTSFSTMFAGEIGLMAILLLIAFAYCVIKIFFQNIKRGGILLTQMAVGSLYMFSVPRGYTDGFVQWIKQVIALCLTAFLQTTLLYLGLMTFSSNMLLGLGIMLAANEVPRIAQQFGMDTSAKFNVMSVVHATTTAVNLTRIIAAKK